MENKFSSMPLSRKHLFHSFPPAQRGWRKAAKSSWAEDIVSQEIILPKGRPPGRKMESEEPQRNT